AVESGGGGRCGRRRFGCCCGGQSVGDGGQTALCVGSQKPESSNGDEGRGRGKGRRLSRSQVRRRATRLVVSCSGSRSRRGGRCGCWRWSCCGRRCGGRCCWWW